MAIISDAMTIFNTPVVIGNRIIREPATSVTRKYSLNFLLAKLGSYMTEVSLLSSIVSWTGI